MWIIRFSVDAIHHEKLGKYINDSNELNAKMKSLTVNGLAKLSLFALKNIPVGQEICYDYLAPNLWRRHKHVSIFLRLVDSVNK